MKNINFKNLLPFLAAIVIFLVLTFGYFTPLLKGKVIVQSDMVLNKGMSKEILDFREKFNSEPLWTNSMFGGMPAYQIAVSYPSNLILPIRKAFYLGMQTPANMLFSYMLGFFILLLVLGVDKWLSIVGAVGFGFSAFLFLIIDAGHNTQALAIGYMAPVFAGVILVCRGKYLLGGAITALFMSLELLCNHVQITYYLIMFLAVYVIYEWMAHIKQKDFSSIYKSLGIYVIAAVLAVGCNISNLMNTYDYVNFTIRGPSELTVDKQNQTSGLDKDYATQWSMGISETMTLMIPGFKGASSSIKVGEDKSALKNVDTQMRESVGSMGQYWGDQPFTTSPYSGAIIVFLFVFGLFIVEGRMKWALLTITILSMALSWGKNMMWLTDLFLDHFPAYNKFRAVSMILVLAEFAIPIIGVLAVDKLLKNPQFFKQKIKLAFVKKEITVQSAFFISFGITGGLSLLYFLMPGLTTFFADGEYDKIFNQISKSNDASIAQQFVDNVEIARKTLFKADALRSFFFIILAAGAIWLYLKSKINKNILTIALGLLILFDLAMVDKNYLNDKNFSSKQEAKNPFPETVATKAILQDTDPDYRVLNIAVNTFNESSTSYYHKSIGGYHAAKLRRYQDLIDRYIQNEIQNIIGTLKTNPTDSALRTTFARQGIINMLNTRYIIYNEGAEPLRNRYALGNGWFVNEVKIVANADEEIKTIGDVNVRNIAVVDEKFKDILQGITENKNTDGTVKLTNYKANYLTYETNCSAEQIAVFSEIYYKDGWNAYVDGQLTPHFRANYVLRAMRVPVGKHTVEFKFEPTRYYTTEKISLASCLVLFIFIGTSLFMVYKNKEL